MMLKIYFQDVDYLLQQSSYGMYKIEYKLNYDLQISEAGSSGCLNSIHLRLNLIIFQ